MLRQVLNQIKKKIKKESDCYRNSVSNSTTFVMRLCCLGGHLHNFHFFLIQCSCVSASLVVIFNASAAHVNGWRINEGLFCNSILMVKKETSLIVLLFISRMTSQRLLLMSTQGDERQQVGIEAVWEMGVKWACVSVREHLHTCDAVQDVRWTRRSQHVLSLIAKREK